MMASSNSSSGGHEAEFHDYPLNAARSDLDIENLYLYNKKLEHKTPTLFMQASADCQVELWQLNGRGVSEGKLTIRTARCTNKMLSSQREGHACKTHPFC